MPLPFLTFTVPVHTDYHGYLLPPHNAHGYAYCSPSSAAIAPYTSPTPNGRPGIFDARRWQRYSPWCARSSPTIYSARRTSPEPVRTLQKLRHLHTTQGDLNHKLYLPCYMRPEGPWQQSCYQSQRWTLQKNQTSTPPLGILPHNYGPLSSWWGSLTSFPPDRRSGKE